MARPRNVLYVTLDDLRNKKESEQLPPDLSKLLSTYPQLKSQLGAAGELMDDSEVTTASLKAQLEEAGILGMEEAKKAEEAKAAQQVGGDTYYLLPITYYLLH